MNIATLASQLKSTQAALILSEENRLYFTGFASSNGTLLVMPEESTFITDSRYYEAACSAVTEARVLLQGQVYQQVFDLLQKHNCTEILVEADRMTLSELGTWRKMLPTYSFNVSNRLDTLANGIREIKCEEEVEKMQKAQDIAEKALEELLHMVKPGVAERDLANELEYLMRKFGADGISFDTIAVSGANSSKPHGVPGEKLIEAGDFLTIDFGALYDHYHSDTTRTFAVGQPTEEMVNVYETVRKAQQAGLDYVRPGISAFDLDKACRDIIADAGYGEYFGHSTGHGVGVEIHEHPFAGPKSEETIRENAVVTVEPGIYLPGKFGVRIEDMVLVTPDGHRNFCHLTKELVVL
ncbi:MAG: aminopeptidase P family protein [Acutalibacteraceae bacterium]|jgi:Xaa-Pro aminopeptidase|nr:aminopeptidase P family protein [Clostridia bacterium]MEE1291855.1 aminopeptidase P family protein [Acutalibacteraceae bacterium]NLD29562.1 aminopeptidase P family protein [Clostridiales bacterium]MBQ1314049.1 aminopeptidase P family protein [Clostridia bacterium]MBQ1529786.1 aminopeptidase P family protein [Clostridia bacterium]